MTSEHFSLEGGVMNHFDRALIGQESRHRREVRDVEDINEVSRLSSSNLKKAERARPERRFGVEADHGFADERGRRPEEVSFRANPDKGTRIVSVERLEIEN